MRHPVCFGPQAGALLDASKGANAAGTLADFRVALSSAALFAVIGPLNRNVPPDDAVQAL